MYKQNETDDFSCLTIRQLGNLYQNIKLGYQHLSHCLSKLKLAELFNMADRESRESSGKLKADVQEKAGNISLITNTIITSGLGGWLGLAAFINYHLNSIFTIVVLIGSIIVGAICGYFSYQQVERRARKVVNDQKVYNLQNQVIELILKKRLYRIERKKEKIHKLFCEILATDLDKSQFVITSAQLKMLHDAIENRSIQTDLEKKYLQTCWQTLEKNTNLLHGIINPQPRSFAKQNQQENSLTLLTHAFRASPVCVISWRTWLKNSFFDIIAGFIPTVLGGFASLFVFTNGLPDLYKEFNLSFLDHTHVFYYKVVSFILIMIITVYFGYAFVHSNYQNYKRNMELQRSRDKLVEKERKNDDLFHLSLALAKIHQSLLQLQFVFSLQNNCLKLIEK